MGTNESMVIDRWRPGGFGRRVLSPDAVRRLRKRSSIAALAVPVLVTAFLWATSSNPVSLEQGVLAFLLLAFPCWLYVDWRENGRYWLPLLALVAAQYWLFFGLPLFWGDRSIPEWRSRYGQFGPEITTRTLEMAVGGMAFLWLGMKSGALRRAAPRQLPDLPANSSSRIFVRCLLAIGMVATFFENIAVSAGAFRQAVAIFQSTVPLVAFAIVARQYLLRRVTPLDKLLLAAFLIVRVLFGFGSGWLGAPLVLCVIFMLVYLAERKRLPVVLLCVAIPYVVFFQAGKKEFRGAFWYRATQATVLERAEFWMQTSYSKWEAALSGSTEQSWKDLVNLSLSRTSLLGLAGIVLEKTPSTVPYQYGRTYEYMLVTFIPRFLWPEKPSMNEANQYFQVAYGVTREADLGAVSIACGMLAEGYMNFGWFGSFGIMFVLGALLGVFQEYFFRPDRGPLWKAVGLVLVPQLMATEFQVAQYLGGIIQQILLVLVVFLPAISMTRNAYVRRMSSLRTPGRMTPA